MRPITLLLCFAFIHGCRATYSDGFLYQPNINAMLTCHVPNPFAGNPGEPDTVEETPPRIGFEPASSGSAWLPKESSFLMPSGFLDKDKILQFLGIDFNDQLSATTRPDTTAPTACDIIATQVGSGGQLLTFQSEPYGTPTFNRSAVAAANTSSQCPIDGFFIPLFRDILMLGNCPLINEWTLLPKSFFPRWYASGRCSGDTCTLPGDLTCVHDIRSDRVAYITVLRWDCCWNFLNKIWRWDCGWRKVQIPIVCDCDCACNAGFDE